MLYTLRPLCGLITAFSVLFAINTVSAAPSLSEDGWKSLYNNQDILAINQFRKALDEDPNDIRALMGLTYTYELQLKHAESWEAFQRVLENSPNKYSMLYASVLTRRFQSNLFRESSGLEEILRDVIENPDPSGIMQAMAIEQVGAIEESRGNVDEAKQLYNQLGAVTDWRLIGPFNNVSASGHDKVFPPEREDDASATYTGANGGKVWWFTPMNHRNDLWIDMALYFPTISGVYYANTYVYSNKKQKVQMRVGTSGSFRLFLNGNVVSETIDEHNNDVDTYITEVTLPQGWSRVLMKVGNSELSRCNFMLRITNPDGSQVAGVRTAVKAEDQVVSGKAAAPRAIANPHLLALQAQWSSNTDKLENAWILAEAHLRNDQAEDAEVVLEDALKQAPKCIGTLTLLAETYQRGRQRDDMVTTTEKLVQLRPGLPVGLIYSFNQAVDADKLDEAEELLAKIKESLPNTREYYAAAIQMAYNRDELAEADRLQEEAFDLFPDDVSFTSVAAVQTLRSTGSHDAAIDVVNKHLNARYSESGLMLKGRIQLDARRYDDWEETFQKVFELSPASPGYHLQLAENFASRKQYDRAISSVNNALADAPYVSSLLNRLAMYQLANGDTASAKKNYTTAIEVNLANFTAREALRNINGEPAPLTLLGEVDVDSLMKASPSKEDYPSADAIVVYDDTKRIVYDGSRNEIQYEVLIRVLTPTGIDDYHEMSLPGGSNAIVEKVVVFKEDGTEIPADHYRGRAVFKGLKPGDFVYYKTRSRVAEYGAMSEYFMDESAFTFEIPAHFVQYQLLVPEGTNFQWKITGGEIPMEVQELDMGALYTWKLENQPALAEEMNTPPFWSIATVLQFSSVPKWGEVIKWYWDIARTKSRSSMSIQRLMDTLFPPDQTFTKEEIIEGVYKYITEEIRYSSVSFRQSGFVPQKARDVLATRIGDCKDVTTLCIAMLAERDIKAYHTLVETYSYGVTQSKLPNPTAFDHDIVMVDLDGQPLYIDCTAPGIPIGSVPFGDIDANSVVVYPGWMLAQKIDRRTLPPNNIMVKTSIEIHDDLSATIKQEYTHTGTRTSFYRDAWGEKSQEDMERSFLERLSSEHGMVELAGYKMENLETLEPTFTYSLEYTAQNYVMEAADLYILRVPWHTPYEPMAALSHDERTFPMQFRHYVDTLHEEITVTMPSGYEPMGLEPDSEHKSNRATVYRTTRTKNDKLNLTRTQVNKDEVVEVGEFTEYKKYHNDVVLADRQAILLAPIGTKVTKPRKRETGNRGSR